MHPNLEPHWEAYEKALKKFWQAADGLGDEAINTSPAKKQWSIAQVHGHLMRSEQLSILYLRKKIPHHQGLNPCGLFCWWNFKRLQWAINGPFKLKAPALVEPQFEVKSIQELMDAWEKIRHDMKLVLESVPPQYVHYNWYKHPLTGRFGLIHMLKFFVLHMESHMKQVKKIREQIEA